MDFNRSSFGRSSFNAPAVSQVAEATGIASNETLGVAAILHGEAIANPTGIASSEAIGVASMVAGPVTVQATGIASHETLGAAEISPGQITVQTAGIPTSEVLGGVTITPGPATVRASGLASREALGSAISTTINLFKYLPRYYLESRIMKSLMDAMGEEVPDAINYLWQVFFANTCPDEGFWLWLREYDARTRDEVYAKMRGGGALNLEMLQALDIEAVETYKLCPEEGIVLSGNDAYFADGIYIGPLISDIYVDPDEVQVAQQLIALAGMAGFRYWLAVKSKSLVPKAPEQSYSSIALYPSYIFPSPDNYLSGQMVLTCSRVTTSIENKSLAKITHWFSPVAFFDENRYWTDDSNPGAVSKVTTSEMEMIRIFPTGDTYLDYLAPDINNNDETILSVGGEGVDSLDRSDYALLKFDLSGFELPRVYSCELFLYVVSTRHFNLHTYPFDVFLLASPFDEETVTPNTAPTRLPEHVARIYLPDPLEENSDGTWISWDISSVLEFWKVHPNYGLLLTHTGYENEGYDAVYFASVNYYEGSMDNAGNWAPYLQIIYK